MYTAANLNTHLANNGIVQITTYAKSTVYTKKHTGYFTQGSDGNLYVQRGKSRECLTMNQGQIALVSIRLGRYTTV